MPINIQLHEIDCITTHSLLNPDPAIPRAVAQSPRRKTVFGLNAGMKYVLPLFCLCVSATAFAEVDFRDPKLPLKDRVDALISQLSVEEKIAQMIMGNPAIPRLRIPAYHWWNEALHGVARTGNATVFPQAVGLAAAWNPDLHQKIADAIATEVRAKNNVHIASNGGDSKIYRGLTIWSPNINIFRDPRWGRGQETYGEDPYLTGRLAVAFVRGLQGNDPTYLKTVATVKHYAVHSGPEELRHKFDAVVSDRDLRETYLPAFEAGITEGKARSLMSAYNAINGVPAPANSKLLTDILRGEWGFSGAVVGDVDTVSDIVKGHHYAKTRAEASAIAIKAGNDLCSGPTYKALPEALQNGQVTEADLDNALRRLFTLRFELGQFDPPESVPYTKIPAAANDSPEHSDLALEAARQSIVLLKNDGILPWNPKDLKTVAILGPTADDFGALVGNYSGTPSLPITLRKGITSKLESKGIKVLADKAIPLVAGFNETGEPFPEGVLFTDESKKTPGLKGELFADAKFSGTPTATRTDEQLDLRWSAAQPMPGIPVQGCHAQWSGVLVPKTSGDYTLGINFYGGAALYFDGKQIAGKLKTRKVTNMSALVHMEAGKAYPIRVEFHHQDDAEESRIQLGWKTPGGDENALAMAKQADHIILCLGITPALEGEEMTVNAEGFSRGDRTSILLPKIQRDFIDKIAALGKPFVVILTNGSPLSFDVEKCPAVVEAWYYGQRGGDAMAEVLLGETNPAGRLPITFPKNDSDLPPFTDYSMKGRTYRYSDAKPLFAFGHGLSYTQFNYTKAVLSANAAKPGETVDVIVSVKNVGQRAGDEVVQVYAHANTPPVEMPRQWLVGFRRVHFEAGEAKDVRIPVKVDSLRRWDDKANRYTVDSGAYELRVGAASDRIFQTAILNVQ